jgi:threonine/homoserine/homoserine lactone efflux protein
MPVLFSAVQWLGASPRMTRALERLRASLLVAFGLKLALSK